jgi:hypothetical protein
MQDGKAGFGLPRAESRGIRLAPSGVAGDSTFRVTLAGAMAALPCVALAAMSAWWVAGGWFGRGLWPPDQVTLAEAIATRNNAEALRLITLGANPNERSRVRDGLLTNGYDVVVLPVEAAVGAQRADSLRMLLANGAAVDDRELRVLRCYERTRRDSGVREILDMRASGLSDEARSAKAELPDCSGVRLPVDRVE